SSVTKVSYDPAIYQKVEIEKGLGEITILINQMGMDGKWIKSGKSGRSADVLYVEFIINILTICPEFKTVISELRIVDKNAYIKHVDFGTSNIHWLDNLKGPSGAIGLYTIFTKLDASYYKQFVELCDFKSLQKLFCF